MSREEKNMSPESKGSQSNDQSLNPTQAGQPAQHVAQAAKLPDGPPYPWRRYEIEAVRKLLEAFPEDDRLKKLNGLITAFC